MIIKSLVFFFFFFFFFFRPLKRLETVSTEMQAVRKKELNWSLLIYGRGDVVIYIHLRQTLICRCATGSSNSCYNICFIHSISPIVSSEDAKQLIIGDNVQAGRRW